MPEGHSVLRWSRELSPLVGQQLLEVELPRGLRGREGELAGRRVLRVEPRGKHLLIHLSGGLVLHCHAMMWGDWAVGPPGSLKADHRKRLRLRTRDVEAVFTSGPLIEILQESGLGTHPRLSALGPDILSPRFDGAEALRRLHLRPDREIGEALLDQEALAGVGNVFKSEALFRRRIHPRRLIREIRPEDFRALWKELARLMRAGAAVAGSIVTLPRRLRKDDETRWVYRRTGRPCFVCGARIETLRQGGRDSYFCPRCQR